MPAVAARTLVLTPDEYLAWEPTQDVRHEYHHGEVYPMPGGTSAHAELIAQLIIALGIAIRGTDCTVRSEAMRVQLGADHYVYPDLTVTCGEATFAGSGRTSLLNPTLVVEVLSPSTRSYDLGEKFELYRSVASVQEVLFVDSERRQADVGRRTGEGWTLGGPLAAGTLALPSVGVTLDLDALYDGVL